MNSSRTSFKAAAETGRLNIAVQLGKPVQGMPEAVNFGDQFAILDVILLGKANVVETEAFDRVIGPDVDRRQLAR